MNFLGTKHFDTAFGSVVRKIKCAAEAKPEVTFVKNDKKAERERAIDENLKKVFEETLEEGIPDRFKNLLSQLKQQDQGQGSAQ